MCVNQLVVNSLPSGSVGSVVEVVREMVGDVEPARRRRMDAVAVRIRAVIAIRRAVPQGPAAGEPARDPRRLGRC